MSRQKNAVQRLCSYPGCGRKHFAKDLCRSHYLIKYKRKQELRPLYTKDNPKQKPKCIVDGCDRLQKCLNKYCKKHYYRMHTNGTLIPKNRGMKSKGGHEYYKNHSLFKRNRLIKIQLEPICEVCHVRPSKVVHHIDCKRDNHELINLMACCSQKCHFSEHRKLRIQAKIEKLMKNYI